CMAGRCASLSPRDLTARPGTRELDRPTWSVVLRPCLLEVVQHVLCAVSCPDRQQAVIFVLQAAAATHGDEPRIPDLGEDHQFANATEMGIASRTLGPRTEASRSSGASEDDALVAGVYCSAVF